MPALETAVSALAELVNYDTQNGLGDEMACVNYLARRLKTHKPDRLEVQTVPRSRGKSDSGYVLAVWGQPRVLLNVHIDTVPAGDGWSGDPLIMRRRGDRLIGLGTSDIKGAAACILAALDAGTPKDVAILFSGDEEQGNEVMPAAIQNAHMGGAPMAIVCEPTDGRIGRRHRGIVAFKAAAQGPGGHSSRADHVRAPLKILTQLGAALGAYGQDNLEFGQPPYKGLCLNVGGVRCDGSYNVIPTMAELDFSIRPGPGDNLAQREADIREMAAQIDEHIEVTTIVSLEPFASRDTSAFEAIFHHEFTWADLPYWTEAALLSAAGINAVVFGPGELDQAHKPDESVTTESLMQAMTVYERAISGNW